MTQMMRESRLMSRASQSRNSISGMFSPGAGYPGSRFGGYASGRASRRNSLPPSDADLGEPRPPEFEDELNDMTAKVGKNCKMTCLVSGNPFPMASWRKDGRPITSDNRIAIYQRSDGECTLRIEGVTMDDRGDYICEASNKFGKQLTEARLTVK